MVVNTDSTLSNTPTNSGSSTDSASADLLAQLLEAQSAATAGKPAATASRQLPAIVSDEWLEKLLASGALLDTAPFTLALPGLNADGMWC